MWVKNNLEQAREERSSSGIIYGVMQTCVRVCWCFRFVMCKLGLEREWMRDARVLVRHGCIQKRGYR